MRPPLVIYHGSCFDGFTCAWLFHQVYPEAEFREWHYGTPPPTTDEVADRDVYIADFSFARQTTLAIAATSHSLTILDHHQTAAAELADLVAPNLTVVFDLSKSGGRLTWEFLHGRRNFKNGWWFGCYLDLPPWLVQYTEDRDLWRWRLPDSRAINAALRSYEPTFEQWNRFQGRLPNVLIPEGEAILRREQQIVDSHVRHAREVEMDGYKVLSVNATVLTSEIANELAKDWPFGVCWFARSDGKRVYSLRSQADGVDVSAIAKQRGGGGHRHAAGFVEEVP